MEKISSILPSNARLKSVDVDDAHPVRPGVPALGRPVGRVSSQDRFSVSQEAKDLAFQDTLGARNPREEAHVKIADDMTKKFFENRVRPVDRQESRGEEVVSDPVTVREPSEDDPVKGSYLNRTA